MHGLQIPLHTLVHNTLHSFPYHTGETDWAIAGLFLEILSRFMDRNHDRLSPNLRESACSPAKVVDLQEGVHCETARWVNISLVMSSGPGDFVALSCSMDICSSLRARTFSITSSSGLLLRLSLLSSCSSLFFSADINVTNILIVVSEPLCCLFACQQSVILRQCVGLLLLPPSSFSCFVSLHSCVPSFSRLRDAVFSFQLFLLAWILAFRNLALACWSVMLFS